MKIIVYSKHLPLVLALRESVLPSGVSVDVEPVIARRDISEAWAIAMFTVIASVPAQIIADLLLEKFKKDKSAVVTINRKEVALEKGEIIRVIEESIKIERQ